MAVIALDTPETAYWLRHTPGHTHRFVEQRCLVCGCGEPANDHGMPYPVATEADPHPGAMVALFLPASVGQQVLVPGGEKLEDLHVTLAYLGDLADLSPAQQDALRETVAAYATRYEPLTGEIGGIGRFAAPAGEPTPVYANVDIPALPPFRQDLIAALDAAGIPVVQNHGFTPHCTLAYLPPEADVVLRPTPLTPVTFAYLWVAMGDARYAYPLGAKKNDEAERARMAEALRELKTLTAQALAQTYTGMQAGEAERWSPTAYLDQPRENGKFASPGPKDPPEVSLQVQAQMLGGLYAHLVQDGELTDAGKATRAAALDHLATTLASNPAFQHLAADPYWREFDEPGVSHPSDVHRVVAILRESWATSAAGLPEMDALHLAARDAFHLDGARTGFVTPAGADLYAKYGAGFRAFVQAQYAATQSYFHAHGYPAGSQITVYRGMTYPAAPPGFAPGHATRTIAMNPLSSWSAQMPTARDFATEDQYGHLIATSIPIEHVMSIAPTGLGSMAEHELILFGHTHPATVVSWDQETEPTEAELWQMLTEAQHGR